jgi:ABC-type multidrug transport system ATPase subunit
LLKIKQGMTYEEALAEGVEKLSLVGLDSVANDRVSTFSGGMKRRLSVSISAIGKKTFGFHKEEEEKQRE